MSNRKKKLIDEYLFTLELEKPKTKVVKNQVKVIREKPNEVKKETRKPLVINPIYRYTKDGDLVDKYLNSSQMAKKLSWREKTLSNAADQEKTYNGFLVSRVSYTKEKFLERFKIEKKAPKEKKPKPIKVKKPKVIKEKKPYIQYHRIFVYNEDGELIATYNNGGDMARATSWNHNTIKVNSTKERVYKGFLLTRVSYTKEQAKQRFTEALKGQQMTYIYRCGELVATFSSLTEVKNYIKTDLTLRKISYHKERHKPIGDYILSSKPF